MNSRDFLIREDGYFLLQDIGFIIAIYCGFVLPEGHYIIASVIMAILAKSSAAFPYFRIILWPAIMGTCLYVSHYHPNIIYELMLGTSPTAYYGLTVGWIYAIIAVVVILGLSHATRYDRSEGAVIAFTGLMAIFK